MADTVMSEAITSYLRTNEAGVYVVKCQICDRIFAPKTASGKRGTRDVMHADRLLRAAGWRTLAFVPHEGCPWQCPYCRKATGWDGS